MVDVLLRQTGLKDQFKDKIRPHLTWISQVLGDYGNQEWYVSVK